MAIKEREIRLDSIEEFKPKAKGQSAGAVIAGYEIKKLGVTVDWNCSINIPGTSNGGLEVYRLDGAKKWKI